jgi:hypothetical protein
MIDYSSTYRKPPVFGSVISLPTFGFVEPAGAAAGGFLTIDGKVAGAPKAVSRFLNPYWLPKPLYSSRFWL